MSTHEPYQLLPPLAPEEYEALKADIEQRGILNPVEVDEHGEILDGHHRAQIAAELEIECPVVVRTGWSESEKRTHARSMNLLRRHLGRDAKRAVIADELRENPSRSNNSIAKMLGVSDHTVSSVRNEHDLHADTTVGDDGKTYKTYSGGRQQRNVYAQRVIFTSEEDLNWFRRYLRDAKKQTGKTSGGSALVATLKTDAD